MPQLKIPHATTKSLVKSDKEMFLLKKERKKENGPFLPNLGPEQEITPEGRCNKPLLQRWSPANQAEGQVSTQEHQLKTTATGSMWLLQGSCHRTTESTSYLHVAAELNREAAVLHLHRFHAGLPRPRAAESVMENHLQVLLLVVKQNV